MGNADLWFMALKKQGVPAEFVRYPRSTTICRARASRGCSSIGSAACGSGSRYWLKEKPATAAAADKLFAANRGY